MIDDDIFGTIDRACIIIKKQNGNILCQLRGKNMSNSGMLSNISGHISANDSYVIDGLTREIKEEAGIELTNIMKKRIRRISKYTYLLILMENELFEPLGPEQAHIKEVDITWGNNGYSYLSENDIITSSKKNNNVSYYMLKSIKTFHLYMKYTYNTVSVLLSQN
jgi:8-oxo-dGTP pyrophosphatase MutT (NUDIX family)